MEGLHSGIKTYQIRIGRMTDAQRRNYDALCGKWCITTSLDSSFDTRLPSQIAGAGGGEDMQLQGSRSCKDKLDFASIFGNCNPVTVEIGFGMGAATAVIAEEHPEINYIGIEVHKPGIGRLMGLIEEKHLANIRIIEHDALEALESVFEDGSVAAFHIFFPDPWPKKRHNKRRLITRPRTDLLAAKLKIGGYLYMVTDWEDYAQWALRELTATPHLTNKYDGYAKRQEWRPDTKFETRGEKEGRQIRELYFCRE